MGMEDMGMGDVTRPSKGKLNKQKPKKVQERRRPSAEEAATYGYGEVASRAEHPGRQVRPGHGLTSPERSNALSKARGGAGTELEELGA